MKLQTAINLIHSPEKESNSPTHWADLGCGTGLFTKALSTLLQPASSITAIDKDAGALKQVSVADNIILTKLQADFVNDQLPLKNLDGILMANALHFVKNKIEFIQQLRSYINEKASLLVVEYDMTKPNTWVPYPLPFPGWQKFFSKAGFSKCIEINRHPSVYNRADIVGMLVNN